MESIIRNYLRARATRICFRRSKVSRGASRGQTMTEYALILAAVAIAVFVTYETMGSNIDVLAQQVDAKLTAAAASS
jgi:Flp pilus assembly pilin Flp